MNPRLSSGVLWFRLEMQKLKSYGGSIKYLFLYLLRPGVHNSNLMAGQINFFDTSKVQIW